MSAAAATAEVCAALGDTTRWTLLQRLGESPASASVLARELPISRQGVAQHLEVLRQVGLASGERRGREVVWTPSAARLATAADELGAVAAAWDRRLQALKRAAERDD